MPIATISSELTGGFEQPVSQAGKVQVTSFVGQPVAGQTTIASSGSYVSPLLFADGYQVITVAVQSSQAGSLKITRFIDAGGTIPRPVSSTSIVANTLLIVDITDDLPFLTWTIEIDNSGGSTANLAFFAILLNAD